MALSELNLQDKHRLLTPSLSAGRPQMLINTVGFMGCPSISPSILHPTSQEMVFFPFPLTYELSKLLSGLAINL